MCVHISRSTCIFTRYKEELRNMNFAQWLQERDREQAVLHLIEQGILETLPREQFYVFRCEIFFVRRKLESSILLYTEILPP